MSHVGWLLLADFVTTESRLARIVHPCGAQTRLINQGPFYYVEVEPEKGLVAVVPKIGVEATEDGMNEQPVKFDEEKVAMENDTGEACGSSEPVGVQNASGEAHALPQPVAPNAAARDMLLGLDPVSNFQALSESEFVLL